MTRQTWMGFAAFSLVLLGMTAVLDDASAIDCSVRPTDSKSAWVYRTVEGRKCWYRGTQVISRSELRWSDTGEPEIRNAQASLVPLAPAEPPVLPAGTNDERHPAVFEAGQGDTFEARWRGLPR